MYLTGCFIILLFVLLYTYLKGNLTIEDIFIYLICIALSWITFIIIVVIAIVTAEFWDTTIWKAKKKSKLSKTLDDLLN